MSKSRQSRPNRRTVLKLAGIGISGIAGSAGVATARNGNANKNENRNETNGKRPLEATPSLVAALTYGGVGTTFQSFPEHPQTAGFDPGVQFDTTKPKINVNEELIHYQLPFGTHKPYILRHEGGGVYTPRGAVTNFTAGAQNAYGLPEGQYRATVREEIHLYEQGGAFDWAVTRVDFFSRPKMEYAGSALVVLWDEDGDQNDATEYRTTNPIPGSDTPEFSEDTLGDVYEEMNETASAFIDAGVSNPGGK